MGLFSKKKEEAKSCCCGGNCTPETMAQAEAAKTAAGVKVLGSGCAKCNALEDAVCAALTELGPGYPEFQDNQSYPEEKNIPKF